ncbi:MAG: hypothetical protein LRY23_00285 [Burkholderiaceae bacterium]|nr:hypothetical protein [Burkholderiaceae bacterium]
MTVPKDSFDAEFADQSDVPVAYMQRTRQWYLALGYDNPYRWAHYLDVPFARLHKPLHDLVVGLVTTAAPFDPDKGDQGPGAPYNARAKFYEVYSRDTASDHDVRIAHVAIDRQHTSMQDPGAWFPLPLLREFATQGIIGRLSPRFHGRPPTVASDIRCRWIVLRFCDAAGKMVLMLWCSWRTVLFVIKRSVSWPDIWSPTASQQS